MGKESNDGVDNVDVATGAQHLIMSNAFQKLCTFSLNQMMLHYSSPEIFGLASIELELLLSTLLFLSREGVRLAVLQSRGDGQAQLQRVVNLSVVPVLLVTLISAALLYWYTVYRPSVDIVVVLMYCVGALLETLAEPLYNLFYCRLIMLPRLRAEMAAVTCRSVVVFVSAVFFGAGIRGFGASQVTYGAVYLLVMALHTPLLTIESAQLRLRDVFSAITWSSFSGLFKSEDGGCDSLLILAAHATGSSILKHVLTEGDKIVLSLNADHFNQGIYAITSNYGSLVARILFQPIEESCRVAFSRMCSSGGPELSAKVATFSLFDWSPDRVEDNAPKSVRMRTRSKGRSGLSESGAVQSMVELLSTVLRGIVLFALVFPLIGSHYTRVAVKLFLGSKWYMEDTVGTLSSFCFYILVIGINGIAESFVHAVISPKSMYAFNLSLICSWVVFMGSSVPLMALYGTPGLVMANSAGMIVRGAFNLFFAQSFIRFASKEGVRDQDERLFNVLNLVFPPLPMIMGGIVVSVACWVSAVRFAASNMLAADIGLHLAAGVLCGLSYVALAWIYCRNSLVQLMSAVRSRGKLHED